MIDADTIAAVATPPGVSAIAIIRLSGPHARQIMARCFQPARPANGAVTSGRMRRGSIVDARSGEKIDDAMAVQFLAPNSYTGEDVIEFHVHGGEGVVAASLGSMLTCGARLAAPGEFTKRAYLNGRMDLAQAEAVADLINAETARAAKAAAQRLQGSVGIALRELRQELLARLVELEAHVDYPDEVAAPDGAELARCIEGQLARVSEMLEGAGPARALRDGIACVIAGAPNAGKSSLLNALVDAERAIVSETPGTTRDIVEDRIAVDGVVLRLRDTAGLRRAGDAIEAEGVARAKRAIGEAELVVLVIDGAKPLSEDDVSAIAATDRLPRLVLSNKLDLGQSGLCEFRSRFAQLIEPHQRHAFVSGSVRDRATIAAVRAEIARLGWGGGTIDIHRATVANLRQIQSLTRAGDALRHARATVEQSLPLDLLSGDFRAAIEGYGEVTGDTVTEEVLDGIFSRFCVGK